MWPTWIFYVMLLAATAWLSVYLLWEALKDVNATLARKWRHWKTRRDHRHYLARHAQFLREGVR